MAIAHYSWFNFFEFAVVADTASGKIREVIDNHAENLEYNGSGMAGSDEQVGQVWGKEWDTAFNRFLPAVCQLADAYGAISNRAYYAGVNQLYVEWVANNRVGAVPQPPTGPPQNADQRRSYGNMPTSIGATGDPLITDIAGLVEQIGIPLPTGNDEKLKNVGASLKAIATVVQEQTDAVRKVGREPGDRDSEDARKLYDEYVEGVLGPSGMAASDANTLASAATTFGEQIVKQRQSMEDACHQFLAEATITLGVGVLGTVVTVGGSDVAAGVITATRITSCANRIRTSIELLIAIVRMARSTFALVKLSNTAIQLMSKTVQKPVVKVDIDKDSGERKMQITFPNWKQEAWERYLETCHLRRGGCKTMEEWSRLYDQLMENTGNGSEWDQKVAEIMDYTPEEGWAAQRHVEGVDGRRYDFVHYNEDGEPDELVENKSGRLDTEQLAKDEGALEQGYRVTYNLKSDLSPSDQRALDRLKSIYGDRLTINYL
ncbi:hypothetical protein AB0I35_30460 [Nocardia sp. NPDC050378]|uniref:hypothetical protein n=1 Tax=Nocardia sp. NPDC050378 TaxID=3155400 RepID=UPI0033FB5100